MEPCYKGESWLNKRVGLYTVVGVGEKAKYANQQVALWKVKCDCGSQKQISKWHIIYGNVTGCCNALSTRPHLFSSTFITFLCSFRHILIFIF